MGIIKWIGWPVWIVVMALAAQSCDSDSSYTTSADLQDCVITSATLGTLYRHLTTTSSTGEDSTYKVAVTGSLYPLNIDQVKGRIYNSDSLPVGTDLSRVVFSAFNATGSVSVRSLTTGQDSIFSATDSTDCSVTRTLTVYAYDGISTKKYKLQLSAHQEEADSFVWKRILVADSSLQSLSGMVRILRSANGTLLVYGEKNGNPVVLSASTLAPDTWATDDLPQGFDCASVLKNIDASRFYAMANGYVCESSDGLAWTVSENPVEGPNVLLAAGTTLLVGASAGHIYSSKDGGRSWNEDVMDDIGHAPATQMVGTVMKSSTDPLLEDFIIVGHDATGQSTVWRRVVDLSGENDFSWYWLPKGDNELLECPVLNEASAASYDGGTLLAGLTQSGQLSPLYMSRDNGRIWQSTEITMPEFPGVENPHLSLVADHENFLWLVETTSGTMWRGRYNRLGWKETEGAYTRSRNP